MSGQRSRSRHRPMYSSNGGILPSVDSNFAASVEPLLLDNQVDLVFFVHVHNYERTCAVYQGKCKGMPKKDAGGIDTYDNSNFTAPVHAIVGSGGFSLDNFPKNGAVGAYRGFQSLAMPGCMPQELIC
ncbi:purple acid phosphatase 18-like [Phragmites australis]|uniref:purple acid phosphatase 18-like n=1 Tax=Phragmites australis TaxID=29695 RepID=UPI002D779405|nr:purple acid phosphatase 18-like [Phragmites australis]